MKFWLGSSVLRLTVESAPPRMMMRMPEKRRNPARVTTNDGILSSAVSAPWRAPNAPQIANAASRAAHHGQFGPGCCTSLKAIAPPISATAPTDKSTSAMSRTIVSAIARIMYTVLSPKMYTRLLGRRKACSGVMISKTTATITIARITGRTPLLPPRIRSHEARKYSPSVWAATPAGTSAAAAVASRVKSAVPVPAAPAWVSPGSVVTGVSRSGVMGSALTAGGPGRLVRPPARGTRCHVLHNALPVEVRGRTLGHHPAQVQHRDPVGDLEDVVQVVGDDHHREPVVPQALDQVEYLPGLHHPEGSGGLVEQHQLGVPHHGLGHRDRLALAAGERCHWLADGAHRGHPQALQGLGRFQLHRVLVEQAVAQRFPAEEHVLDDVQVVGQRQVLVDGLNPKRGGVPSAPDVYLPSLEEHLAVVRLVGARDAAGEHRLPGPVVTAQAGHLASGQVQVHPVERLHRPEVLVDAPQLQQGFSPVPAAARAFRGLVHLSHFSYPSVACPVWSALPARHGGVGGLATMAGPPTPG